MRTGFGLPLSASLNADTAGRRGLLFKQAIRRRPFAHLHPFGSPAPQGGWGLIMTTAASTPQFKQERLMMKWRKHGAALSLSCSLVIAGAQEGCMAAPGQY